MLPPGSLLANRFRLESEIARGGMGAVWTGYDQKLKRQVAIKLLQSPDEASESIKARFEREAMAVAQLQSPHVVQIFDYGVDQGMAYIVMELLHGEDLHKRLKRERRLSLEATSQIIWQTAKALGEAHEAGIIHRDMKPANIFLARKRDDEIVKVLDFGVARMAVARGDDDDTDRTSEGVVLGTPKFMSPEQARGLVNSLDARTDLWSIGVIAFRALTGRLPFHGLTPADFIIEICTGTLPRASEIAPDLPPAVDDFFAKALARNPDDRFATARELAVSFARIARASYPSLEALHGLPSDAGPASGPFTPYPSVPGLGPASGWPAPSSSGAPAETAPTVASWARPSQGSSSDVGSSPSVTTHPSVASLVAVPQRSAGRRTVLVALGLVGAVGVVVAAVSLLGRAPESPPQPAAPPAPSSAADSATVAPNPDPVPTAAAEPSSTVSAPATDASATKAEPPAPPPRAIAPKPAPSAKPAPKPEPDVWGDRF